MSAADHHQLNCPRCGERLPKTVLGGLCRRCVGHNLLAGEPDVPLPGQNAEATLKTEGGPRDAFLVPGYQIERELGRGGMGVVYKARHLKLKRTVALKMVLAGGHAGPRELARFRTEAEAVARLQHPNIVQIHEVGEAGGHPYCALEFVDGPTLASKLSGKALPIDEAARLVETLARAIQLAHTRNVVHRDLKPANILLTSDGTPKITDFGLARQLDSDSAHTLAGAVMGTPSYMAPEQASGHGSEAGPAADVYALGAILYECLAGRPPFKGKSVIGTLDQVRTEEPEPVSHWQAGIPLDLDTICLKCLRKEPESRYGSAAELADELGRYLRGEPILARPIGLRERAWKWAKRNPSSVAGISTVTILLAAVAVAGGILRKRGNDGKNQTHALGLVQTILNAETAQIPALVGQLGMYRQWADPLLRDGFAKRPEPTQKLHASLALLPVDPKQVAYLYERLLEAVPSEVPVIRDALARSANEFVGQLWTMVETQEQSGKQLRAAAALAKYDPKNQRWEKAGAAVVNDLVRENVLFMGQWIEMFRSVKHRLLPRLIEIFQDQQSKRTAERSLATGLLADYAADQTPILAELLMIADPEQFALIYPKLQARGSDGLVLLMTELDKKLPPGLPSSSDQREELAKRQANAAVSLLRMNQPAKVWPLLQHSPDPRVRSYLIHRLRPLGADPQAIVKQLEKETDITIQRALLLSLGEFNEKDQAAGVQKALLPKLKEMYRAERDPGLHASIEWLLRTWSEDAWLKQVNDEWALAREQQEERLQGIRQSLSRDWDERPPQWYVNGQGQTFVVIPGPVQFMMGAPEAEKSRVPREVLHRRRIGRSFAIASKSVTVDEYYRLTKEDRIEQKSADLPATYINWYAVVRYCNLLNEVEGIDKDQWCYLPNENNRYEEGMKFAPDYLKRTGYRLPTEAEMEYAIRAGAITSRYYGETEELLPYYAWYVVNSAEETHRVGTRKPNDFGLFDALGNCNAFTSSQNVQGVLVGGDYPPEGDSMLVEDKEIAIGNVTMFRVTRGGAYAETQRLLRSASRWTLLPLTRSPVTGVRPARTIAP